jgi:hypothetical protein
MATVGLAVALGEPMLQAITAAINPASATKKGNLEWFR